MDTDDKDYAPDILTEIKGLREDVKQLWTHQTAPRNADADGPGSPETNTATSSEAKPETPTGIMPTPAATEPDPPAPQPPAAPAMESPPAEPDAGVSESTNPPKKSSLFFRQKSKA